MGSKIMTKKHKLEELRELKQKYELQQHSSTGEIRVVDRVTRAVVDLPKETIQDLIFIYSWERAWDEAGLSVHSLESDERGLNKEAVETGYSEIGQRVYDCILDTINKHLKDGNDIDYIAIADEVYEIVKYKYTTNVITKLFEPNRLAYKDDFNEIFDDGILTPNEAGKDPNLYRTISYLVAEAIKSKEKPQQGD